MREKYYLQFIWTIMGTLSLGILIKRAMEGSTVAIVALAVLGAVALMVLGALFMLAGAHFLAKQQQKVFLDNAKENLSLMDKMIGVQNRQNAMIMRQTRQALPSGQGRPDIDSALQFDDAVFSELED